MLSLIANTFASSRHLVRGESMAPALRPGHVVLVDRRAYRSLAPARGDVVLVHTPAGGQGYLVKRVVGLPGEFIELTEQGVYVDDRLLREPYAMGALKVDASVARLWHCGDGYFVMGDNRRDSFDSRRFGPVDARDIAGKLWFCVWPRSAWGRIAKAPPALAA